MNILPATERFYIVETPKPEIPIDPDLQLFYRQVRKFLAEGAQSGELSSELDLEENSVRLNLEYLRQLGFVRWMDDREIAAVQERRLQDEIFDQNNKFLAVGETLLVTAVLIAGYTYYFLFC